jgi:alkylation response protein AidB-like acyl-CoA dehydrogenase
MTLGLSAEDVEIRDRARRFVDEDLIPWEVHAEEHGGRIPEDVRAAQSAKVKELGLFAMNMPKDLCGFCFSMI